MKSKLFIFLCFIFIIFFTFSSKDKKRKRNTEKKILNPPDKNIQKDYSQTTLQSLVPNTTNILTSNINQFDLLKPQNVERSIVINGLLNNLLEIPNLFRYIFAYLSLFDIELRFKCTSSKFYHLYEKYLQEEKLLLKQHLMNKTIFLENINCTRVFFDVFEKRLWKNPDRSIEYVNVDSFSEDLVLFPKSIRQIIWLPVHEIEYKYVLFKDGHLSILKQLNNNGPFVFAENDVVDKNTPYSFQENIRCLTIDNLDNYWVGVLNSYIDLHKTDNFTQHISHQKDHLRISEPFREPSSKLFLKNFSGYLHGDEFVNLLRFEKQNNGIYTMELDGGFKTNVKEIKSKDFEHYAEEVLFIFKTN